MILFYASIVNNLLPFYIISNLYNKSEDGNKLLHQRLGCMHGEELAYLFGAPLASQLLGRSIGHFASNYSKPEVTLSEAVMTYWINFAKFGFVYINQSILYNLISISL